MTKAAEIPTAAKRLQTNLGKEAIKSIKTWDDIKKLVPAVELNALQTGMKNSMNDASKTAFKNAKKEQKADFVRFYLLDPKEALCRGFNEVTHVETKADERQGEWLHRSQLNDHYKDKDLVQELIDAGEFDEQPSEFPTQAATIVKQYRAKQQSTIIKSKTKHQCRSKPNVLEKMLRK